MARYINETILATYMGQAVVDAIEAKAGVDLNTTIEQASDIIASYLRNSGYAPPDTTTPSDIADKTIHAAVAAIVWEALASVPEVSIKLPDGWATHPCVLARDGILNGEAQLSMSVSTISAVGGAGFTNSDPTLSVSEGGRPQRASRKELASY